MTEPSAGLRANRALWVTYLGTVLCLCAWGAWRGARVDLLTPVALHVFALALCMRLPRHRAIDSLLAAIGLPTMFSAVGLLLPGLHPAPFEWTCIAADRALFGCDPTVALQRWLSPLLVEVLQLAYASFYFLPVALLAVLLRRRAFAAFDECLAIVTGGFLLSYLGYYVFPTLPPYRFLDHGGPLAGLGLAERIHALLDALEANRYDCFPSGHTMMTLVTLQLAWRHARGVFWGLLPVGVALCAATLALRYHYAVDVLAGAALAPIATVGIRACVRAYAR